MVFTESRFQDGKVVVQNFRVFFFLMLFFEYAHMQRHFCVRAHTHTLYVLRWSHMHINTH